MSPLSMERRKVVLLFLASSVFSLMVFFTVYALFFQDNLNLGVKTPTGAPELPVAPNPALTPAPTEAPAAQLPETIEQMEQPKPEPKPEAEPKEAQKPLFPANTKLPPSAEVVTTKSTGLPNNNPNVTATTGKPAKPSTTTTPPTQQAKLNLPAAPVQSKPVAKPLPQGTTKTPTAEVVTTSKSTKPATTTPKPAAKPQPVVQPVLAPPVPPVLQAPVPTSQAAPSSKMHRVVVKGFSSQQAAQAAALKSPGSPIVIKQGSGYALQFGRFANKTNAVQLQQWLTMQNTKAQVE